ncbi:MAG: hypothetical protein V7K47_00175 [Nostoc sp.]
MNSQRVNWGNPDGKRASISLIPSSLQLLRYTIEERINEIIRYHQEQSVAIANPHTYIIEEAGRKSYCSSAVQI